MPTATTPTVHELQERVVATVRQGEETALDAIRTVVDTVTMVAAGAYDFAGQLLAEQRKFTEEVLKAAAPLRPGTKAPAKADK